MNRLLALLPLLSVSCGAATSAEEAPSIAAVAPEAPADDDPDATLPMGAFPSIETLCARQKEHIAPILAERSLVPLEGDEIEEPHEPSCEEDAAALAGAHVTPGGPILQVSAVTYEIVGARATSLVARTRAGWIAVNPAVVFAAHDDPGCPSIVRDDGVREVRVQDGRLVIVDNADRGWGDSADLYLERARACAIDAAKIACDAPVTIAVSLADAKGTSEQFRTTYTIGADGEIVVAREWEAPEFAE